MKIGGMGYAILHVTAEQLRELHRIPKEVEFESTLSSTPPLWSANYAPGSNWYDAHPFYFRIKHRYLPRPPDHGPLMIMTLDGVIKQMEEVRQQEEENRGKPVPPNDVYGSWIDDDA